MISVSPKWYAKRWVVISLHGLFWVLFIVSPYLITISIEHDSSFHPEKNRINFYLALFLTNVTRAVLFYLNSYLFIPKLAYTRRVGRYMIVLLVSLFVLIASDELIYFLFIPGLHFRVWSYVLFELPTFILII